MSAYWDNQTSGGYGDAADTSMTFAEMLAGGRDALLSIIGAGNDIKKALGSSSVAGSASDTGDTSKGIPVWMWAVGALILYKVAK